MQQARRPKISITGDLGSGKSVVGKIVQETLGYPYLSTGQIQREIAAKHGMTTLELNRYAETHPEIDFEIDQHLKDLNATEDPIIVDSRMAWFFVEGSFKVFLSVDVHLAAARIFNDTRRKSETYATVADVERSIIDRKASENERYLKLYGAACDDLRNFDLVVDTSFSTPEEVAAVIVSQYRAFAENRPYAVHWRSPRALYPTDAPPAHGAAEEAAEETADELAAGAAAVPVRSLRVGPRYFVYGDHGPVSAALRAGTGLLPLDVVADDEEVAPGVTAAQYARTHATLAVLRDWEAHHGFRFAAYPDEAVAA